MELIIMLLVPLPLGFFVRQRVVAYLAYTAIHAYAFTFQTLALLLEWSTGSDAAFPRDGSAPWSYAIVNGVFYGVGLFLVWLGHRLGSRRRARKGAAEAVNLS